MSETACSSSEAAGEAAMAAAAGLKTNSSSVKAAAAAAAGEAVMEAAGQMCVNEVDVENAEELIDLTLVDGAWHKGDSSKLAY